MKIIKETSFILIISLVLGFGVNIFHPNKVVLSWERPEPAVLMNGSNGMEINENPFIVKLEQVKELISKPNTLLIDARMPEEFEKGHMPGAINVSFDLLGEHVQKVLDEPRDRFIITYCDGPPCEKSIVLAQELNSLGFDKVGVYLDGLENWIENGNKISKGVPK